MSDTFTYTHNNIFLHMNILHFVTVRHAKKSLVLWFRIIHSSATRSSKTTTTLIHPYQYF